MADYIVIYDPDKEIAAIVNADDRIGFGPAFIGPDAERALTEFLESVPYDVAEVDSAVLRSWFEGWAGEHFQPAEVPAVSPAGSAVEPPSGNGVDAAALADATAAASGGNPPAVQPSDTDMEVDASTPTTVTDPTTGSSTSEAGNSNGEAGYVGTCFACNGAGVISLVDGDPPVTCSACRGTGKLPAPVA